MSEKRQKFVTLAEARVNKAIKDFQLIGNLSNRSAYEYADEDIKKVFSALQKALDSSRLRFAKGAAANGGEFKL